METTTNIFKEGSKEKLRFSTNKGLLSIEQLWDLSLTDLDSLVVSLDNEVAQSGKKSFLVKTTVKDKISKLRFDIALDILTSKNEEEKAAIAKIAEKERKEKILAIIASKKDESLSQKSVEELEAML